jgi:hypothetical protein
MSPGEEDMVHFSDRRHRLNAEEVGPVMGAVHHRLKELIQDRGDLEEAEALLMALWRFHENRVGRPSYPEPIGWQLIENHLDIWAISQGVELDALDHPEEEVAP